jgi:hypothetical protein
MTAPQRLEDLLRDLLTEVRVVDVAATAAALTVAGRGFSAASVAEQLLAESDHVSIVRLEVGGVMPATLASQFRLTPMRSAANALTP